MNAEAEFWGCIYIAIVGIATLFWKTQEPR